MARILFGVLVVFAAFAQATFLPAYNPLSVGPDLVLTWLLLWCVLRGLPEGFAWAFGLGILLDVLAVDPLGTNALALLPVALIGGFSRRRFFHLTLASPVILMIGATLVHAVVLLLLRGSAVPLLTLARLVLLQSALNVLLMLPLYVIASALNQQMISRRRPYLR